MDLNTLSDKDLLQLLVELIKRVAALEAELVRIRKKVQVLEGP